MANRTKIRQHPVVEFLIVSLTVSEVLVVFAVVLAAAYLH